MTYAYRIGDIERSRACDLLAEHYAAGRLSREELEHRLTQAVQAVTAGDLAQLTADLPALSRIDQPAARAIAGPRSWPASLVVAVVALVGSVLVAGGMLLVLGVVSPLLFLGACVGGTAATVSGISATYLLLAASARRGPQPAAGRSPAPR